MKKSVKAYVWVALAAIAAPAVNIASGQDLPSVIGVVTRVNTASDFDVNGQHIFCASITRIVDPAIPNGSYLGCPKGPVILGRGMAVWGEWDKNRHILATSQIELAPPPGRDVSGAAIVELTPTPDTDAPGTLIVRADGYRIRLVQETAITWIYPVLKLADIKAGNWIEYRGTLGPDGSVVATSATIKVAALTAGKLNARGDDQYDPAAAPASSKQNALSEAFKGVDPKRFPPYNNEAMQQRISDVGKKLIPSNQLALPDTDLAKIDFRFQLVETNVWWDATPLPSGTILVPHELVERMQNDSQLAAVLADSMASILEGQDFRTQSAARAVLPELLIDVAAKARATTAQIAGLTPGSPDDASTRALQQSGRVALDLMHDAGFDIYQAPIAWWLLSRKKPAPNQDMPMPRRAAYLYQVLGQFWGDQPGATP